MILLGGSANGDASDLILSFDGHYQVLVARIERLTDLFNKGREYQHNLSENLSKSKRINKRLRSKIKGLDHSLGAERDENKELRKRLVLLGEREDRVESQYRNRDEPNPNLNEREEEEREEEDESNADFFDEEPFEVNTSPNPSPNRHKKTNKKISEKERKNDQLSRSESLSDSVTDSVVASPRGPFESPLSPPLITREGFISPQVRVKNKKIKKKNPGDSFGPSGAQGVQGYPLYTMGLQDRMVKQRQSHQREIQVLQTIITDHENEEQNLLSEIDIRGKEMRAQAITIKKLRQTFEKLLEGNRRLATASQVFCHLVVKHPLTLTLTIKSTLTLTLSPTLTLILTLTLTITLTPTLTLTITLQVFCHLAVKHPLCFSAAAPITPATLAIGEKCVSFFLAFPLPYIAFWGSQPLK
jgi:hypothetical protein